MCGIVGGIAERNVTPILMEGLRRLEYRGYDSSGMALLRADKQIERVRSMGKIKQLENKIVSLDNAFSGQVGIAHTRWATHGVPAEHNAHPHICNQRVAVVHNGIIENYQSLKKQQLGQGYRFTSETDTEVVAHAIYQQMYGAPDTDIKQQDLLQSVMQAIQSFQGAYALGVVASDDPETLIAARKGSPLVIGIGIGEHFIASDVSALLPVTQNFIFLEDGDVAVLKRDSVEIFNAATGEKVERPVKESSLNITSVELGEHRHYMHKEIFEQPQAVIDTLEGRITQDKVLVSSFGPTAESVFSSINRIHIIACGTSYHAGMVAKYWAEDIIGLPCQVEVASEFRYRNPVIENNTLFVTISQSGETADTLAALQQIKGLRQHNPPVDLQRRATDVSTAVDMTTSSDSQYYSHPRAGGDPDPNLAVDSRIRGNDVGVRGNDNFVLSRNESSDEVISSETTQSGPTTETSHPRAGGDPDPNLEVDSRPRFRGEEPYERGNDNVDVISSEAEKSQNNLNSHVIASPSTTLSTDSAKQFGAPPSQPSPFEGEGAQSGSPSQIEGECAQSGSPSHIEGEGAQLGSPSHIEGEGADIRRNSVTPSPESGEGWGEGKKQPNIPTLSICNVAESSLTREADLVFLTNAGPEIGVASTKAFTTQLVALALMITSIGKVQNRMDAERERLISNGLQKLPNLIQQALRHEPEIQQIAESFADKQHALFLGRGTMYPIALEGALKLKEISYIHAEAYPAGELKHGPLALIDENMPVIAIAPLDDLLEKLKSNLQEVKARGGQMIVFEDERSDLSSETGFVVVKATTNVGRITAPITYNILLQLLSYHVALIKGTDVDQPRNLAKSVTVE